MPEPGISKTKLLKKVDEKSLSCGYLCVFLHLIDYKSDLLLNEHVQICHLAERQPS